MKGETPLERLRRKAKQEWDMAGMALGDGDRADYLKHIEKARTYEAEIKELS